ncbi:MAG: secretion system X translation initiation factor [Pseudomonadota bacterium]|nr:secretion system X translation initiation factor [Pseudomonadota bacterium]
MNRRGQGRTLWLGGALLAALLATQWVSGEDGGADPISAIPEERGSKREIRADGGEPAQLQLERLERRKFNAQAGDLFGPKSWIPPPLPTASQPPSPPPPLLFKYLGKLTEGDETRIFLALAERNYVVKAGENIDNQYRIDEVTDHAITFTYLPLGAKQTLSTGGGG